MNFKIGYEEEPEKVRKLFNAAFNKAVNEENLPIEAQFPLEIALADTGDFALEWVIYYYTKDVRSIIKTRQQFRSS